MADHDFYVKYARVRETHCCHFQHSHIIEHIQKWSEKKRRKNFRWRKMYWIKRMCKKTGIRNGFGLFHTETVFN